MASAPTAKAQGDVKVQSPAPVIAEHGPHHRVWQTPDGGSYTELESGMNYWTGSEWAPSMDSIGIVNGFGVATQAQIQVVFSPSINAVPATDLSFEGQRFTTHILGLAYYDYASGKSVMFCEAKDAIGQVDGNTVTYQDAFSDGVKCDVVYTYKKNSFEQDLVIRAQLPSPQELDATLNPATTRLQAWTEFVDSPVPVRNASYIYQEQDPAVRQNLADPDFKDEELTFGELFIGRGKAFVIDTDAIRQAGINVGDEVPVGKEWITTPEEGRHFLVESVELSQVKPLLDTLPTASLETKSKQGTQVASTRHRSSTTRAEFVKLFPKRREFTSTRGKMKVAQTSTRKGKRFVLDYVTVLSTTNYTFAGDSTYYITGTVTLSGTNTVEGGAVIKYANTNNPSIILSSSGALLQFTTGPYHPAVFTAKDDNSVGATISGSTGIPTNYYANHALEFDSIASTISNIRVRYASIGVYYSGSSHTLSHSQFIHSQSALKIVNSGSLSVLNSLVSDAKTAFEETQGVHGSGTSEGENLTIDSATTLVLLGTGASLSLTNSLLVNITTNGTYAGSNNATNSSSASVFQTVGEGAEYLLANSPYVNAGTTNITASLLSGLRLRTTFPPLVLTNPITADTWLSPQAQRDTDAIDLGYHYDPLDYVVSGVTVTNATLGMTNSVAVAYYGSSGIKLQTGGKLASNGNSPTNLARLVRFDCVQEQANTNWAGGSNFAIFQDDLVSGTLPEARLRFTELGLLANGGNQISGGGNLGALALRDCRVLGGGILWNVNGTNTRSVGLTNSLFERTTNLFGTKADAFALDARNNLFKNGSLGLSPTNSNIWTWYDNVFDGVTIVTNSNTFTNDYNGYLSSVAEFASHGTHDFVTNVTWQIGSLGSYYQPTNSPFLNTGSRNATNAGLYHFCVTTNQWRETNSIVDIGLHYVALTNGVPWDYDADGVPDYLEDANGNGVVDSGETDWQNSGDWGLRVWITRPKNNSPIP